MGIECISESSKTKLGVILIVKIDEIPNEIIDQIGRSIHFFYPRQGYTSKVVVVTTNSGQYAIKMSDQPLYMQWLEKEYRNLLSLQETNIPIPKVHSFTQTESGNWLVLDYLDGVSMRGYLSQINEPPLRDQAITSYGEILRYIHCAIIPKNLITQDHWLDNKLLEARYNLNHYEVDGDAILLSKLEDHRPDPIPQTLIHGDFTIDNVIIKNHKMIGVIDWSGAAYGDPRYDLSLAIRPKEGVFDNDRDRRLFFEAYQLRTITEFEFEYFEKGLYEFF